MARIRTIKPEFWSDEKVVECSVPARLLFIGLWNFADDAGRQEDAPRQIKMKVFPGDDFTAVQIEGMLRELSDNGLVLRYAFDNRRFIQIKGWRHQVINKPQRSKIPGPDEANSGNDPGKLPVGMEGNGKEGIKEESHHPESVAAPEDGDNRPWDESLTSHERALVLVWRATGSSDDQIRSWLVSTRGPHRDRIAGWMRDCNIPPERLPGIITDILDRCEGSDGVLTSGGQPIRDLWAFLGKAVPVAWSRVQVAERAEAERDLLPSRNSVAQWEHRRSMIAKGMWSASWPRPEDQETPDWARTLFAKVIAAQAPVRSRPAHQSKPNAAAAQGGVSPAASAAPQPEAVGGPSPAAPTEMGPR
jgi:hypothetical protein